MSRLDDLLRGPHLRLPHPLDAASDWWSARRPRVRMMIGALVLLALVLALDARVRVVDDRWGGEPVTVVVTTDDLAAGDLPDAVRTRRLPPAAVPPRALHTVDPELPLALAAPAGTILTAAHIDARGPAAGLAAGMRAVPVPTEPGWGVAAGGWVDVWVLGDGQAPARLVARGRPVLQVRDDTAGLTSLVGLSGSEVQAVTSGLAVGRVLLAHAPPRR